MPETTVRLRTSVPICALVAIALVGCGRYQPLSDPSATPTTEATASDGSPITRCADVPRLPNDPSDFWVNRSPVADPVQTVEFVWAELGPAAENPAFTVRVDDPSCAKRPDIQPWLKARGEPPRFEDARIVLRPGQDRAYVGYTIISKGEHQYASPGDVRVVGPDGRAIRWKQQTATGGPGDIVAMEGRQIHPPGTGPGSGD